MTRRTRSRLLTVLLAAATCLPACRAQAPNEAEFRANRGELRTRAQSADPTIRGDAAVTLARYNLKSATELILDALDRTEDDLLRLAQAQTKLVEEWDGICRKVDFTRALRDKKERDALDRLRALMLRMSQHYETVISQVRARDRIVEALGTVDESTSMNLLAGRLRQSSRAWVVRSAIAEAFGSTPSQAALQPLIDLCNKKTAGASYDPRIAVRCIEALSRRQEPEAEKAIAEAARAAEDWQVKAAAFDAIGRRRYPTGATAIEEVLPTLTGRLVWDARQALKECRNDRDMEALPDDAFECLNFRTTSRNVVFVLDYSVTMANLWDETPNPKVDESENLPKIDIAKAGIKSYLRAVIRDFENADDEDRRPEPFRFNLVAFRHNAEFFKPGMVEVKDVKRVSILYDAMKWLDFEKADKPRECVGNSNITEALDRVAHLFGFGAPNDLVNFEEGPDTVIVISDRTPNVGPFCWDALREPDQPEKEPQAWRNINELISAEVAFRMVHFAMIPIGHHHPRFSSGFQGLWRATGTPHPMISYSPGAVVALRAAEKRREEAERRRREREREREPKHEPPDDGKSEGQGASDESGQTDR